MPTTRIKQVNRFIDKVIASQASLEDLQAQCGAAIGDFLRAHNLPAEIRMGSDPRLNDHTCQGAGKVLAIKHGRSDGLDLVSVSHAEAALWKLERWRFFRAGQSDHAELPSGKSHRRGSGK